MESSYFRQIHVRIYNLLSRKPLVDSVALIVPLLAAPITNFTIDDNETLLQTASPAADQNFSNRLLYAQSIDDFAMVAQLLSNYCHANYSA